MENQNEEINKSQQKFVAEDILNSVNALVHVDNLESQKMVWGNDRFMEMLGFTTEEVISMGNDYIKKYYHPDDIKKIPKIIDFFKNNKVGKHNTLFRVKHKNGNWIYFITTRSLFKNDPRYVVSVSINLNENINCGLMLSEFIKIRTAEENKEEIIKFSDREKEISSMMSQGFTNNIISEKLFISVMTVKTHRTNIYKKAKVCNSAEFLKYAKDVGLV